MKIKKVLNNNTVLVVDNVGNEKVVFSRGIGFRTKKGEEIQSNDISKTFVLSSTNSNFENLIQDVPFECFEIANLIIEQLKQDTSIKVRDLLNFTLADHINSIVIRMNKLKYEPLKNELLFDLKYFYENEFNIASSFKKKIEDTFKINITEDEVGFIALHLVNGQTDNGYSLKKITELCNEIEKIVIFNLNMNIDKTTFDYSRFQTHLKYFSRRLLKNDFVNSNSKKEDEIFSSFIENEYSKAWKISNNVKEYLIKQHNYYPNKNDLVYLTIHIQRLMSS